MDPGLPWPRSRAAIGVALGAAAWAALVVLDARGDGPDVGGYLLRALSAGSGPMRWLPIAAAAGAAAAHGAILRRTCGRDPGCWQDAAASFACLAFTLLGWAWAIHHTPFADPFSLPRRIVALTGLATLVAGLAVTAGAVRAAIGPIRPPALGDRLRRSGPSLGSARRSSRASV